MSKLATIGIDMDGVIHDFAESIHTYLKHKGYKNIPSEIDSMAVKFDFFTDWGIDLETYDEIHYEAIKEGFAYNGSILDDASHYINQLAEAGHEIYIITSRPKISFITTIKWLDKHNINCCNLVFSEDKTCIQTDTFLEDNLNNYLALEKSGSLPFLVDRGWNKDTHNFYRRVANIGEFTNLVIGSTPEAVRANWNQLDKNELISENIWY